MLPSVPIKLFLYISKLLHLPSPTLLLREDETIPMEMCLGNALPIVCIQYGSADSDNIHEFLLSEEKMNIKNSPVLVSRRDHQDLLAKLSEDKSFFDRTQMWIVPVELVNNMHLRVDSRVLFYNGTQSGGYEVFESYAIKGGRPISTFLFEWNSGLKLPVAIDFLANRSNLQAVKLINAWFTNPPFITHAKGKKGPKAVGFYVDILNDLQSQLNFTFESVSPRKGKWGNKQDNGSWSGVIGMLHDKQIDITAVGTLMNIGRHSVVDFLWPLFSKEITLLSSTASKPKLNAWEYVHRFSPTSWLICLAFLILAAILFSIASRQSFSQGLTLMARLLFLKMGYDMPQPPNVASKALLMIPALTFMLVFIYFESELTATMTSKPRKLNINSFEDVINEGYTVLPMGQASWSNLKSAPKDSAMKWVFDNQVMHAGYAHTDDEKKEAMRRVREEEKTLLMVPYSDSKVKSYEKEFVNLKIREAILLYNTLVLQKNSEFTELFNYRLLKMMETGNIERMKLRAIINADQEFGISEAIQLGYENVMDPFMCFALGILAAAGMGLLEYLYVKIKRG